MAQTDRNSATTDPPSPPPQLQEILDATLAAQAAAELAETNAEIAESNAEAAQAAAVAAQLAAELAAANVSVASTTHAATSKVTPVDADEIPLADSAAAFGLKKLTWLNIKATLKTYFDTLYVALTSVKTTSNDATFSDSSANPASTNWTKGMSLGWGQTWQNVTASRASGTTYTNSSGKPIQVTIVAVFSTSTVTTGPVSYVIGTTQKVPHSFIVPNGISYSATNLTAGFDWLELR